MQVACEIALTEDIREKLNAWIEQNSPLNKDIHAVQKSLHQEVHSLLKEAFATGFLVARQTNTNVSARL